MSAQVSLSQDLMGTLRAAWGGQVREGLVPVRCFPLSQLEGWVSLCDRDGREVLLLETLDGLDAAGRALLLGELERREFMPVVQQVLSIQPEDADPSEWRVVTDRGEVTFTLPGEDNVRPLAAGSWVLSDANGIRYRVSAVQSLDPESRRLLARFCP
jgi:hypothetical protein